MKTINFLLLLTGIAFPVVGFSAIDCSQADKGIVKIQFKHGEAGPADSDAAIVEAFSCLRTSHSELKAQLDAALLKAGNALGVNRCSFVENLAKITLKSWDNVRPDDEASVKSDKLYLVNQGVECYDSEAALFAGIITSVNFYLQMKSKITNVFDINAEGETVYTFNLLTAAQAAAVVDR